MIKSGSSSKLWVLSVEMGEKDGNGVKDVLQKALLWVSSVLVAINVSVLGYAITALHDLDRRLNRIEASRFTVADGATIYQHLSAIDQDLARIPDKIPPQWLRDFIVENRARIKELEDKGR